MKNYLIISLLLLLFKSISSQEIYPEEQAVNYNPLIPDNLADPSMVMFNDTFYLYATTDIDRGLHEMGIPVVWKSVNFVDWNFKGCIIPDIDWHKPYNYINDKGQNKTGYFRYWAPGKPIEKGGLYYLFPTIVKPDDSNGTYVMVATHPEGPFKFTNGKGLYFNDTVNYKNETKPIIDDIDGEPFTDDNGEYYIYWRRRNASKLNQNLIQLEGENVKIPTKFSGYSEGPVVFKRNNIYYYIYTLSGHANYCNGYMISREGPLGQFEAPDGNNVFVYSNIKNNVWGPGHGNVFKAPGKDEYIFLYLEYGEGGTTRQIYANRINFDEDGYITTMEPDTKGIGYINKTNVKKENLALKSISTASSYRIDKTVTAKIIPDPNQLTTLKVNTRDGEEIKRIFTYEAGNAIDGSYGTRWWASEDDENPWIMIDLGSIKKVSTCEIYFIFPTFGHAFTMSVSSDDKKWKETYKMDDKIIQSPHNVKINEKVRYIKITDIKGIPGIWEIKIYP